MTLLAKIQSRSAHAVVMGIGYVGLPLVAELARAGFRVTGYDKDPEKVRLLGAGESYIHDVPSADLAPHVATGKLDATTDPGVLREADAVIVCVPTPLNKTKDPDMRFIVAATDEIAAHQHPDMVIVLESTTYPGTTSEVLVPKLTENGFELGKNVFVAFSPERVDPGNAVYKTKNTPKVIGGATPACLEMATALYSHIIDTVVPVSSTEAAEMVKLLENTFRAVNIGLVNEVAMMSRRLGLDPFEVIRAAATKPFGFMPFYPGPGLGGHCLAGSETVCVRDGSAVRVAPLSEIFDQARHECDIETRVGDVDVVVPRSIEALSVDPETGASRFEPVTHLFRRESPTPLLRLRCRSNRTVSVTDGHPMLVLDRGNICVRRASELSPGDAIVLTTSWPEPNTTKLRFDLVDAVLNSGLAPVRVVPRRGSWKDHDATIRQVNLGKVAPKDVYRHNSLPLAAYIELEQRGIAPFGREEVLLATGKGSAWNLIPAVLEIDESFARLIGYYLSEGCITRDGSTRIRWCFGAHEGELIQDTTAILGRLGIRHSVHWLKSCATVHIKVSSKILGHLFDEVFECGRRSEEMRIPAVLMAAPEPIRRAVLSGLLRGDGDAHVTSGPRRYTKNGKSYEHAMNAATAGYFSSSPILLQQVTLLLQGLGFVPSFKRDKPQLRMNGAQVEKLIELFAGAKRTKLERYKRDRKKPMTSRMARQHGPFATVELAEIEPIAPEPVFSMEVAGTHTFVSSYGIAVHNCIPIDPLYLSWKLRTLKYQARFIELADTINSSMPAYVVERVTEALNAHEKAVKGSKILIYGVAYKKDVSDVRESPAFSIIHDLQTRGGEVSYMDPHVPEIAEDGVALRGVDPNASFEPYDCVVIVTDHATLDRERLLREARLVVDTRDALAGLARDRSRVYGL